MKETFGELYTRLYNENVTELEHLREKNKKATIRMILLILIGLIFFMIVPYIAIFVIMGTIIAIVITISKGKMSQSTKDANEYKRVFKKKIVTPLIENVFASGTYEPEKGWTRTEYMCGGYRDDIDRYSSEDMVTAMLECNDGIQTIIQFAEIHTEKRSKDSEGRTTYHTQFYGLASRMALKKDISSKIYIRSNNFLNGLNKTRVKMDMSEFEKIFDVEAEDKILALRILTADVMTELLELYRKFKYRFEIHIINKTIYMRISTGEVFEPNIFKNAMEYKTVERYYNVLKSVMSINKHIYDIINEIEL